MSEFVIGIHKFLAEDDLRIVIPKYQRGYSWTKRELKVLWEDIDNLLSNPEKTHFLGGIISIKDTTFAGTQLEIIDGQQRLTTMSLLILALIKWARTNILNKANEDNRNDEAFQSCRRQFTKILRWIGEPNADKLYSVKLKLRTALTSQDPLRNDYDEYDKIKDVANSDNNYSTTRDIKSKIRMSFEFFYDKIIEKSKNTSKFEFFKSLIEAIQRITVANIALEDRNHDNPQQVFESMNATGLDLKESDKCRNLMVLGKPHNRPDSDIWLNTWEQIEKNTLIGCKSETDLFLQAFLKLYRIKSKPGVGDVNVSRYYDFFKNVVKACHTDVDIDNFYNEIRNYSEYYNNFKTKFIKQYRAALGIENSKVTQFYPLIMELTSYLQRNIIDEIVFKNALSAIETFIIRKQVCSQRIDVETSMKRIISELNKLVLNNSINSSQILELIKYYLLYPMGDITNCTVPDINTFETELRKKDLYKANGQLCRNILVALECSMQTAYPEPVNFTDTTIEHIYPQRGYPNDNDNDNSPIKNYLHKLGNLTLITHNSELSARTFYDPEEDIKEEQARAANQLYRRNDKIGCSIIEDGQVMHIGYKYSKLCLNANLRELRKWDVEDIEKRHNDLIEKCLKLWPDIKSSYHPSEDIITEGTLSHEDDEFKIYSNYYICAYRFEQENEIKLEPNINNWPLFRKICINYLIDNYRDSFNTLLNENKFEQLISNTRKTSRYVSSEYCNDIFIFQPSNGNADRILPALRDLIIELGLEPVDFVFYLTKSSS